MSVLPIPVNRYLVPPVQPSVPEGFMEVSQDLTTGLPHTMDLSDDLSLVLLVPNGLAHHWRDADPKTLVTTSATEIAPVLKAAVERCPARLLLQQGDATVSSVPLVAGLHRRLPDDGNPRRGVMIELVIVNWDLRAGSLRGAGDFGSRITVAWRRVDAGVDFYFELPELPPFLHRLRDLALTPMLFPRTLLQTRLRGMFLKSRSRRVRH